LNKRIRKKKIKQRYTYGINLLSDYCELPKDIIIKEVSEDLWEIASDLDEYYNDFHPYLDSVSIGLMWKHGTGWAGREMKKGIVLNSSYDFVLDEGKDIDEEYKDYIYLRRRD
jgi:hypothetical protein